MSEMAKYPRQQLPDDITDAFGTAKAIASAVHPSRAAALRTALAALETRFKERTAELEAQVIKREQAEESLHELTIRMLQAHDDEAARIARELHDSVGQYLAAIQMNLSAMQLDSSSPLTGSHPKRVSESVDMVSRCVSEIRTISYLLHPPLLEEMGLACALELYSKGFNERSGICVELDISTLARLPADLETAVFRIVQQGLSNIHRHSGSNVAKIAIRQEAEVVTVKICDAGRGMSPDVLNGNSGARLVGVGLAGMRERTRALQGRFHISSSRKGTTIEVSFPVSVRP